MRNSIQTRLSIILILTATVILSGFAFFNHVRDKSSMEKELLDLTGFWAKQLSKTLILPIWNYDNKSGEEVVNSTMLDKQIHAIIVRNAKDAVLYGRTRDKDWNIMPSENKIPDRCYIQSGDIFTDNGKKIGSAEVCITTRFMQEKLRDSTVIRLITLMILNVSLIFFLFVNVRQSIMRPLCRIVASVRIIASGDFEKSVHSERKDEIGQLAFHVETMRVSIKKLTEDMKEKERLKSEMELAQKIQTVLLPKNPVISGYEIAASCDPSEEVGGDYYDVISVGGFDWIVIGDVSGHGVTAGLVMMMVQTAIHTVLVQNPQVSPSRLLCVINRVIYENIAKMDEQKHMTIIVIACGKDGFFDFSGLHEDILLRCAQTGKVEKIETDGMWIGLEEDISNMLPVNEFKLSRGDCMVLYTDGITEARGRDGRSMFGEERLREIVESSGGKSAAEIHNAILDTLKDYEKLDDVTLFVMKRVTE